MPHNSCKHCGTSENLVRESKSPTGYRNLCKSCLSSINAARREDPEYRDKVAAQRRTKHRTDPRTSMLSNARVRAKAQGVPFDLTLDDFVVPKVCPAMGIDLFVGGTTCPNSPTLDKIKPELGYVPGNVVVVSHMANRIKSNATPEQLLRVASYYGGLHDRN